jgi:uncharacterized membrane protein YqgA involved in biofilm formation
MGIFTGVLANCALVIAGTLVGCLFKGELLERIGIRVRQAFAFFVMVLGIGGALDIDRPIFVLASLIIGIAIGEIIDIDDKFNRLGNALQRRFAKGQDEGSFAKGFVTASLIFCIGSMTIMGALQSGLENEHSIYFTKGVLDCVTAATYAMSSGISVAFSAICVLVYQGLLTLFASFLQPVLSPEIITLSTQIGSLSLIGIALGMLEIKEVKVANFLPAMFIPMIYQAIMLLFAKG